MIILITDHMTFLEHLENPVRDFHKVPGLQVEDWTC